VAEDDGIFRQEALDALSRSDDAGNLLQLMPNWTRWAYALLVIAACAGLSFSVFAFVGEYASGAAVVRVDGKTELTAAAAGTVDEVRVQPGERVKKGQLLVRFHVASEQAELERLSAEEQEQLAKLLRDPGDQAARTALVSLRPQLELARARVEQRSARATRDGIVSDVLIRPGQLLAAGDLIVSLLSDDTRFTVVAFLPGQYRPLLHAGQPIGLRLAGFPHSVEQLTIERVGEEVVGPSEVKRYLGQALGDALQIGGPVVLVTAQLPARTFLSDSHALSFYDGLPGVAEARVRSQRVIVALIPGLSWVFGDG
jgi:membrane fusion protein (multidrug efflux system)